MCLNINLTDTEFGYFLAGLIEGDDWFRKRQLHNIFAYNDRTLPYYIKNA